MTETKIIDPTEEHPFYVVDGQDFVRVTNVIDSVMGGPKSGMAYWGANRFADYIEAVTEGTDLETTAEDVYTEFLASPFSPDKTMKAAGQRGTQAHDLFEALILGNATLTQVHGEYWIDDGVLPYMPKSYDLGVARAYHDIVSDITGLLPEHRVYSKVYRYAGKADLIGGSLIADVKTHKPPARYTDFVQMAAYSLAWWEMTGTEIDAHMVIIPQEDGEYITYHSRVPDSVFLACLDIYRDMQAWEWDSE